METTIGIIGQTIKELRLERRLALEVINSPKLVRVEERETFRFEGSPITYSVLLASFPDRVMGALLVTIEPYDAPFPPISGFPTLARSSSISWRAPSGFGWRINVTISFPGIVYIIWPQPRITGRTRVGKGASLSR